MPGRTCPPPSHGPHPLDVKASAALAGLTASMSPQSAVLAWTDWATHLAASPGKQSELLSGEGGSDEEVEGGGIGLIPGVLGKQNG